MTVEGRPSRSGRRAFLFRATGLAAAVVVPMLLCAGCGGESAKKPPEETEQKTLTHGAGGIVEKPLAPDATVGAVVLQKRQTSYQRIAATELRSLSAALTMYAADTGGYPPGDSFGALEVLVPSFVPALPGHDPWGSPYRYDSDGNSFTLWSEGPDATPHTEDDVVVRS
jgi:hypothetical protein